MSVIVRPTKADKKIARTIARNINPATEKTAEILTWGADEGAKGTIYADRLSGHLAFHHPQTSKADQRIAMRGRPG
jgi:hypothetical protein